MLTKNVIWNSWLGKESMIGSDTFKKPYGVFVYEDLTSQSQHSVGITCFFSDCYFHFTTSINSLTLQSPLLVCLHLQSARFQKIRPLTALPITYWEADTLKLACFPLTLLKPRRGGLWGGKVWKTNMAETSNLPKQMFSVSIQLMIGQWPAHVSPVLSFLSQLM